MNGIISILAAAVLFALFAALGLADGVRSSGGCASKKGGCCGACSSRRSPDLRGGAPTKTHWSGIQRR